MIESVRMSKTLSHSIQDPFDTTVFDRTTRWGRYAVLAQGLPGDDYEHTATLNALREATPLSYRRFWQLHMRGVSADNSNVISMFTWLGPQRLIAIIRLADSHNMIKQIIRVDNHELWHQIAMFSDTKQRNSVEARQMRASTFGGMTESKAAHNAAAKLERENQKLEKQIHKLYERLIA